MRPARGTAEEVAVDETAVKLNGELSWLYAAIDLNSVVILDATVIDRRGTDSATAFLRD